MSQNDLITVELIHEKAQALRTEADYLERLERELRQATAAAPPQPPHVNLLQVVRQLLADAPQQTMKRKDIIQAVRSRHGQAIKPIGIISTLARKSDFKRVDKETFALRQQANTQ